jgi:dienelactone hydrolase
MLAQICLLILPSIYTLSSNGENTINGWLEQSVLAPDEFKVEVQKFIKRHIPPLEVPDTADEWRDKSDELRSEILQKVIFRGVPEEWFTNKPDVVWGETIETGKGYLIRKLRYEALPGLWIPALLYEPAETGGKVPAVLNVNGHVGPPGKTIDYEQIRCINLAKRGMLALHPEWLVFGELAGDDYKHNRLAYLDLCGTSGVSVFFLAMRRGIDVLEMYPATDPGRIAMTGLSGGGWQTIILTSLDTRISAITPNAGYIGLDYRADFREDIGDLEQNPNDLLTIADYTHLTAMLAPRPTLLIYNDKDDCCFKSYRARPSVFEPIIPFFQLFGVADDFQYHENTDPGTHNYDKDNREQFYRFINRCFLPESDWVDSEIPSDDEVLEYEKLVVGLPENNANFFTLGCELMVDLPGNRPPEMLAQWQKEGRDRLRDVLRFKPLEAEVSIVNRSHYEDLEAVWYKLVMNGELSVPAAVISKSGNASGPVAIVFADKGKRALREQVKNLVQDGSIVIATDPMFMGECMPENCPFCQYAQMVSTVGERPLGIQAAQMGAVIQWACQEFEVDKVSLHGVGWNASVLALCACALYNDRVESVYMENYPESLKKLIEDHTDYEQRPALFCFGLLEQFDMPELKALCSPVKIEMGSEK